MALLKQLHRRQSGDRFRRERAVGSHTNKWLKLPHSCRSRTFIGLANVGGNRTPMYGLDRLATRRRAHNKSASPTLSAGLGNRQTRVRWI
jgi:hypothetical protein